MVAQIMVLVRARFEPVSNDCCRNVTQNGLAWVITFSQRKLIRSLYSWAPETVPTDLIFSAIFLAVRPRNSSR